jgi:filamentous hemagglutinin
LLGGASAAGGGSGKTTVYVSTDSNGNIQYVGITDDIQSRARAHLNQKGIFIEPIPGLQGISREDARAVEQVLIEYNGLGKNSGTLLNKINSISKNNPVYAESLKRGAELLKSIGFEGFEK